METGKHRIVMVGAGMMASALSFPLRHNGHAVALVGSPLDGAIIDGLRADGMHRTLKRRLPEGVEYYKIEELDTAMDGASLLLCGVSSFGLDWFIENIIPRIPTKLPVLSVTKGMLDAPDGTMRSYPEVFEEAAGRPISFNAIGGPCTSYELADEDPSAVTFCGRNIETLRFLKSLFETPYYHVSLSEDVRGVECAVALKNAYALAVGLAIGMSYRREGREFEHYNSQAALFGQSVKEMQGLLKLCEEKTDNIMLAAGDLYVTVFGGRTRRIGILLGKGLSYAEAMEELAGVTLESIVIATRTARAVRALMERGLVREGEYPLLLHVDALINGGAKLDIPWKAFERETLV